MKSPRLGPLGLLAFGAATMVLGSFLFWLQPSVDAFSSGEVSFPTPAIRGTDVLLGTVALGGGLVAFAAALLGRRLPRIIACVIGAVTAVLGGTAVAGVVLDPSGVYLDGTASRLGSDELPREIIRASLEFPLTRGLIELAVKPGVWVVLAGSAVMLIGALGLGLAARSASSTAALDERVPTPPDEIVLSAELEESTSLLARADTVRVREIAEEASPEELDERPLSEDPKSSSAPHQVSVLGDSWVG